MNIGEPQREVWIDDPDAKPASEPVVVPEPAREPAREPVPV